MSIHPLSWVLKNSESTGGCRLVLIVLADHAHDDGSNAYPSVATMAREARMSERAVQYALRKLEEAGEIVKTGVHPAGMTMYALTLQATLGAQILHPADSAPGAPSGSAGVQPVAPEPSVEPSKDPPPPTSRMVRFKGKRVPAAELALAEQLLDRFNAITDTSYPAYTRAGGPSESLQRMIGAVLDLDGLTLERGEQMIRHALQDPFWSPDLPLPGNVFGRGVRDRNFQAVQQRRSSRSGADAFIERAERKRAA